MYDEIYVWRYNYYGAQNFQSKCKYLQIDFNYSFKGRAVRLFHANCPRNHKEIKLPKTNRDKKINLKTKINQIFLFGGYI